MGTASRRVSRFVLALAVVSFVGSVAATLMFGTASASPPAAPIEAQAGR